ncbi:MAG: hypothetical protein ACREBS_03820 [Nitrososphaerales archaeon]
MLGLFGILKSTTLQTSGELGPIVALVIAIGIAGIAIIIIYSKKGNQ